MMHLESRFRPGPFAPFVIGQDETGAARMARRQAVERRRTARDLRQAVEGGEFSLSLAPRRSLAEGRLRGAEASIRWPRRKLGLAPPGSLVPLLEKCGLMLPTTAWMLEAACGEAARWPAGASPLAVSLDVPAGLLCDGRLPALVAGALERSGLSPGQLEIELPEGALEAAGEDVLLTLAALRDLGIGLALDQFGSVSAGLLTLKRLPLTVLKLDRVLVRDLPQDRDCAAAVRTVIAFAHALDMRVVAIGVDTEAQCDLLREIGCDEGQGSLLGGAVVPDAFADLCAS